MNIKTILILIFLTVSSNLTAETSEICKNEAAKIESTQATASTWANLRNSDGSLKRETDKLLSKGFNLLSDETIISISSKPAKYLSKHSDNEYCEKKLIETEKTPIIFSDKKFSSFEELNNWIADFSQGKGEEGKELYSICDKSCSPQYIYNIEKVENNLLKVDAIVICGLVRDKNDNMYNLELTCSPKSST